MNIINGDLIKLAKEGEFDIIIHGCNCFNTMGAGFAKQIKKHFRSAYLIDKKTIKGDIQKLGTYSFSTVNLKNNKKLIIINAYTQYCYGGNQINTNYNAIRNVFRLIKKNFSGYSFGFPKIGCGLGGGDWEIVSKIINEELINEKITLVNYIKVL